ncbi:MAG: IspD/TarI family cytidylyltransferase, partial [Mycobacteriales bacterium]
VHDAARPLVPAGLVEAVVAAVRAGADAAVPGLPMADTVKSVDTDGWVVATLARDGLRSVQTPQAFRWAALAAAHARAGSGSAPEATDDAALVEAAGGRVRVVAGDPLALKVTTPTDLRLAEALLSGAAHGR